METSLKPVPHKDVPAVSPCLSEVLAATVDSPVDSSLLHSSIPIITITDCSEPAGDSQDLCLLCDSTDPIKVIQLLENVDCVIYVFLIDITSLIVVFRMMCV